MISTSGAQIDTKRGNTRKFKGQVGCNKYLRREGGIGKHGV